MTNGNFKISDDFQAFEAETNEAAQEAAKQEMMVMGIPMPLGTAGVASICGMEAGKSKVKVDQKTMQQTGGHPMVTIEFMVESPQQYAGMKAKLYFTLNQSPNQTVAQKYQRLYDCFEKCGLPRDLRGKPLPEIAKYFLGDTVRRFNYDVIPNYANANDKVFNPIAPIKDVGALPNVNDINMELNQIKIPSFSVGQTVNVAGNPATIIATEGVGDNTVRIKFANGQEMNVPISSLTV